MMNWLYLLLAALAGGGVGMPIGIALVGRKSFRDFVNEHALGLFIWLPVSLILFFIVLAAVIVPSSTTITINYPAH